MTQKQFIEDGHTHLSMQHAAVRNRVTRQLGESLLPIR
jgi:hypothetical protein